MFLYFYVCLVRIGILCHEYIHHLSSFLLLDKCQNLLQTLTCSFCESRVYSRPPLSCNMTGWKYQWILNNGVITSAAELGLYRVNCTLAEMVEATQGLISLAIVSSRLYEKDKVLPNGQVCNFNGKTTRGG